MTASADSSRRLVPAVRALLATFAVLTVLATSQLFVRAEDTAQGFAWTIDPPLTAAFFGGGYAAGCVLVVLSLRSGTWAQARVGYLTVLLFTVVALAATLLHLDKFHFGAPGALPRAAAWVWLVVYVVVPVAMLVALRTQLRARGEDRSSGVLLGPVLRTALGVQAAVLVTAGLALFFLDGARALWPWSLTELTARALASWLVALGVGAVLAVVEDDAVRLRPAATTYAVLGLLQLLALARFRDDVDWGATSAWVYVVAVVGALGVGATGMARARTPAPHVRASVRVGDPPLASKPR